MGSVKFVFRIIGIVALLAIFVAAYALTTSLRTDHTGDFSEQPKTLGALGGFHLLTGINYDNQDDFWRIALSTTMNRVSPLGDEINTPYVEAQQKPTDELTDLVTELDDIAELGPYCVVIDLSDTSIRDGDNYVFVGDETQPINLDNLNEIRLYQPDDSSYQILVGVDGPVKFRLQKDTQDTGIVWLDVLK